MCNKIYEQRHTSESQKSGDVRTEYQRDRARIIHSAAFRRLQGKTQVMGVGEGDFHRTRLTHSIECAQIGNGMLHKIQTLSNIPYELKQLLDRDLIEAACLAHDLGHPPFGHGGERSLHQAMRTCGGFEGNAQTLRIITRLEKCTKIGSGINPTRRLVLAILKYPVCFEAFDLGAYELYPPKCYYSEDKEIVNWLYKPFTDQERRIIGERDKNDKPLYRSFDSSLMELADDVAYAVHDIEDIIGRQLVQNDEISNAIRSAFDGVGSICYQNSERLHTDDVVNELTANDHIRRKTMISKLVGLFITNVCVDENAGCTNTLLRYKVNLPKDLRVFLGRLKKVTYELVIQKPEVQQLECRGQRIVREIFDELKRNPKLLIPRFSEDSNNGPGCRMRHVCDYVAGMTDAYAERVYGRLFTPGCGSARDEL